MSGVAILGAGDLGGAIAHALASRGRVRSMTIVDEAAGVAAGKALDLVQAAPIDRVDVRIGASADLLEAVGASVIVIADPAQGADWSGDRGLGLLDRLVRAGTTAAFVLAGPAHGDLMATAVRELNLPATRLIGSAASSLVGTAQALVGLEVNASGTAVSLTIVGRPPKCLVAWSAATVDGSLVTDRVPPHRLLAVSRAVAGYWPPSPRAVAAPTARIVEALVDGSRKLHQATTVLEGELGVRGVPAMLPVALGSGRVRGRVIPSLSVQEHVAMMTSLGG